MCLPNIWTCTGHQRWNFTWISSEDRTGPNIWQTHRPSSKPSIIWSLNTSEILTYVPSLYPSKYTKVVPIHVPLIVAFLYSVSNPFWGLFHTLQPTTNPNTTPSQYIILFQYLLLIFYVINISNRKINWTHFLVSVRSS